MKIIEFITKLFYLFICIVLIILAGFEACINSVFFPDPAVLSIRENLAMDIEEYQIEFHEDTHGGFHGDGEEIIIFDPNDAEIYKIYHQWQKTPVDSGIASLTFPEMGYNGLELRKYIPKTDGFWFYKNRNSEAVYSHNFSFAFFDGEKVYYYELDT